jgi:hypothetical protein
MFKNIISVTASMVDGSEHELLAYASPKQAIDGYFLPDQRPPVRRFVIDAVAEDGKRVRLILTQDSILIDTELDSGPV